MSAAHAERLGSIPTLAATSRVARWFEEPGWDSLLEPTAIVGQKLAVTLFIDGATKIASLIHATHTQAYGFSQVIQ